MTLHAIEFFILAFGCSFSSFWLGFWRGALHERRFPAHLRTVAVKSHRGITPPIEQVEKDIAVIAATLREFQWWQHMNPEKRHRAFYVCASQHIVGHNISVYYITPGGALRDDASYLEQLCKNRIRL